MDDISRKYDQEFFLNLVRPAADTDEARAVARERWNDRMRTDPNITGKIDFSGVDFREHANRYIRFDGFTFQLDCDFSRAIWSTGEISIDPMRREFPGASFIGSIFLGNANFLHAQFGNDARFDRAQFHGFALFSKVIFGDQAWFSGATFHGIFDAQGSYFGYHTKFDRCEFKNDLILTDSFIGKNSDFGFTVFSRNVYFDRTIIESGSYFHGCVFNGNFSCDGGKSTAVESLLDQAMNKAELEQDKSGFIEYKIHRANSMSFLDIDFSEASFSAQSNFAHRDFAGSANFSGAHFHQPPNFDGSSNFQRQDFTGAQFFFVEPSFPLYKLHWTDNSKIPIRLRAFRAIAETTKNHDLERDLYIEERKAERGVYWARYRRERRWLKLAVHALWIAVMGAYWAFSDYGRSLLRPVAWFALSIFLFMGLFIVELHDKRANAGAEAQTMIAAPAFGFSPPPQAADPDKMREARQKAKAEHLAATRQLAISNAIPFVGPLTIDSDVKKFLLCGMPPDDPKLKTCTPIAPKGYQATLIAQNLFAALLLFFFGLALRNYFKVK